MNGWQRIWVALTVPAALIVVVLAYVEAFRYDTFRYETEVAVERDLQNPNCRRYAELPMVELQEPGFAPDSCWQLYNARRYSQSGEIPYTMQVHRADRNASDQREFLMLGGAYLLLVALIAGFFYIVGLTVRWIRAGFREDAR